MLFLTIINFWQSTITAKEAIMSKKPGNVELEALYRVNLRPDQLKQARNELETAAAWVDGCVALGGYLRAGLRAIQHAVRASAPYFRIAFHLPARRA
jgi:hypothetical protein